MYDIAYLEVYIHMPTYIVIPTSVYMPEYVVIVYNEMQ